MTYLATTIEGFEDICAQEISGNVVCRGRVSCEKLPINVQGIDILFEKIGKGTIKTIEDVEKLITALKVQTDKSIRVTCLRNGNHPFNRVDIEQAVGQLMYNEGKNIELKQPEKILLIDIVDEQCFVGWLVKENLCKRDYRVKINSRSISACLAHLLLKWLAVQKNDRVLDPFCVDGVLAIEAAKLGCKVTARDPVNNNIRNAKINIAMAEEEIDCEEEKGEKPVEVDHIATAVIIGGNDARLHERIEKILSLPSKNIGIITNKKIDLLSQNELREVSIGKGFKLFAYKIKKN